MNELLELLKTTNEQLDRALGIIRVQQGQIEDLTRIAKEAIAVAEQAMKPVSNTGSFSPL